MLQITTPEQLEALLQDSLSKCYFLLGNDQLLLQESQDIIIARAQHRQFSETFYFYLDCPDWDAIFNCCQTRSLFAKRQIILLRLPQHSMNTAIGEKLYVLASILHEDCLLILRGNLLTSTQKNSAWFKALSHNAVLVSCMTPEPTQLARWVITRANNMKLVLDDAACQLLCYCYEGNLFALVQVLERLSVMYPDGHLTLIKITAAVNDAANFTKFHWINAVLTGNSKRAGHILQQLRLDGRSSLIILLRSVQHEVVLLLTLKRQATSKSLSAMFDKYHVLQSRRPLLIQALQRLSTAQLHQAVALMKKIELELKHNYSYSGWLDLNALALLLSGQPLPVSMINSYDAVNLNEN